MVGRALALGLLVVASYLPALEAGFVWDDTIFADEPVVHAWSGLWNIWFSPADIKKEGHYWPVVYTSFWLEHKPWGVNPLGTSREPLALGYSFVDRILIAARALWFYVGKLLWPTGLAIVYPLWEIDPVDPVAWIYVLAAAALPALLWIGRDRLGRGPLAGALFYAVTLSPVLGFVDYGYMQYSPVERFCRIQVPNQGASSAPFTFGMSI